ncbi:F0F1 ATP synthase subunit delta [Clostridiaceae bacterium 35-E11]
MAQLVAKTYSKALFEVAIESNQLDKFVEELKFVLEAFQQNPMFYELYKTPQISNDEKKEIIGEVFGKKLSAEIMNFLKILLDKRRTRNFEEIVKEYQRLANNYNNIVEGVAVTAIALKKEDQTKIESKLSNITGKKIKLKNEVDPSIIGGILVRIGDKVIDGTVQSRLGELQEDLAQIIV